MDDEEDLFVSDEELRPLIERCEQMLQWRQSVYFDVHEFVALVDHYLENGLLQKAADVLEVGMRQHPASDELWLKHAGILLEQGEYRQSLDLLNRLDRVSSSDEEVWALKGFCYVELGDIEKAESYFEKALACSEEDLGDRIYTIAVAFMNIGNYEIAQKYLQRSFDVDQNNSIVLYDLAYCCDYLGNHEEAVRLYQHFLDIDPYSEFGWYNLGVVYNRMERYADSIEAFDFALAINSSFAAAYYNKANTLANWERYDDAIETYREYLKFENESVHAMYYIGECYEKLEQYEDAIHNYKAAITLDGRFADAWYGLGIVHYNQKMYLEAKTYIEKALQFDDNNAEYWYGMGNIFSALGDHDEDAFNAYQRALKEEPNDPEVWTLFAKLVGRLHGLEQAIEVLEGGLKISGDDAEMMFALAALYYRQGTIDKSKELFDGAMALDTFYATTFFEMCEPTEEHKLLFLTS